MYNTKNKINKSLISVICSTSLIDYFQSISVANLKLKFFQYLQDENDLGPRLQYSDWLCEVRI